MRGRARTIPLLLAIAATAGASPSAQAAAAPRVEQLVVFRDGEARARTPAASSAFVRVRGRHCRFAAGTPLAALVASRVARLRLRDFGSCSRRATDAGGLFVSGIGSDLNRGRDGWVYKVGTRLGTAGAADPAGPLGNGPVRQRARLLWFYCRYDRSARGCQRTLAVRPRRASGGVVEVRVSAYDDRGRAVPGRGATVRAGSVTAVAGADGTARLTLVPGRHLVYAERAGLVRSFAERVEVG